jgi:hypothetical protein
VTSYASKSTLGFMGTKPWTEATGCLRVSAKRVVPRGDTLSEGNTKGLIVKDRMFAEAEEESKVQQT